MSDTIKGSRYSDESWGLITIAMTKAVDTDDPVMAGESIYVPSFPPPISPLRPASQQYQRRTFALSSVADSVASRNNRCTHERNLLHAATRFFLDIEVSRRSVAESRGTVRPQIDEERGGVTIAP